MAEIVSIVSENRAMGRQRGFSLLEVVVTVVVLGIVAALAAPGFAEMQRRTALTANANEVVAAMQTARMEAIRLNMPVNVVCDGASCATNQWQGLRIATATTTIREHQFSPTVVVRGSASVVGNGNQVTFNPDGFVSIGAGRAGSVGVCSTTMRDASNARDVMVNVSRISTAPRTATSNCAAPPNTLASDGSQ